MKIRQRGITVIETVGALAIGTMMLLGLTAMIDTSLEDLEGQQAAHHQAQVAAAAKKYIGQNYAALIAGTSGEGDVGTVTVADLIMSNLLPSGFQLTNAYNQATCVLVKQRWDAVTDTGTGQLDALVVTTGGQPIEDRHIAVVASGAGQGGGYISADDYENAKGASWRINTGPYRTVPCEAGGIDVLAGDPALDGGHLASHIFFDRPVASDFLHRKKIAGLEKLNTMDTPILMDVDAAVVAGASCTGLAIAVDENGKLATCVVVPGRVPPESRWTVGNEYWKEPVQTFSDLASVASPITGEVRMVRTDALGSPIYRAFAYEGTGWKALAVDEAGNFSAPGNVSAGNDLVAGRDLNAGRRVRGRDLKATNFISGPRLFLDRAVVFGQRCNEPSGIYEDGVELINDPIGSLARDLNNWVLICQMDETFGYVNGTSDVIP